MTTENVANNGSVPLLQLHAEPFQEGRFTDGSVSKVPQYLKAKIDTCFKYDPNYPTESTCKGISRWVPSEVISQTRTAKEVGAFNDLLKLAEFSPRRLVRSPVRKSPSTLRSRSTERKPSIIKPAERIKPKDKMYFSFYHILCREDTDLVCKRGCLKNFDTAREKTYSNVKRFFEFRQAGLSMEKAVAMANRAICTHGHKPKPGRFHYRRGTDQAVAKLIDNSVKETKRECLTRGLSAYMTIYKKTHPEIVAKANQIYVDEMKTLNAVEEGAKVPQNKTLDLRRFFKKEKTNRAHSVKRPRSDRVTPFLRIDKRRSEDSVNRVNINKIINARCESRARAQLNKKIKLKIKLAQTRKDEFLKQKTFGCRLDHVSFILKRRNRKKIWKR